MRIMKAVIWIFFLVAFDFLSMELAFSQENLSKIKNLTIVSKLNHYLCLSD